MHILRLPLLAAAAACSLALVAAAFASLPPGGTFDDATSVEGWSFPPFEAGELAFDLRDAHAAPASGSLRVTNASALGQATAVRATSCLGPAIPGARYHVAADLLLPRAQLVEGHVRLILDWFTAVECVGVTAVRMELDETLLAEPASEWVHVTAMRFVPPGVRSVAVRVEVVKRGDLAADPTRALDALVDNLQVRPFASRLHAPFIAAN